MGKFDLGNLVMTRGVAALLESDAGKQLELANAIARHHSGDWGDVDEEDKGRNDKSLEDGTRLLSVYNFGSGEKFWIITEADRSVTTALLPEEY